MTDEVCCSESDCSQRRSRRVWPVLILLGVVAALMAAGYLLDLGQYVEQLRDWVTQQGFLGYVVVGGAYVIACVLMLPGSALTLLAGVLFGVVWGTVTVSIASTLGASAAFWVGRTVARGWVEQKVAGSDRFAAIDEAVGKQGLKIVFLTRLSPIFPFNLQNYAYGLTKVAFWKYVLASWIGMLPGTLMYVYLGDATGKVVNVKLDDLGRDGVGQMAFWMGLAAAIVVAVLVARIARNALRRATESGEAGGEPHGQATGV